MRCLRKWYYTRGDSTQRSAIRNSLTHHLHISHCCFYNMLGGRTLITNERARQINHAANIGSIWHFDIFAQ